MKPATLFVFIGQLAFAMAQGEPKVDSSIRYSVLSVLQTAMPGEVQSALAARETSLSFGGAGAPDWYKALPADVKIYLEELYPEDPANSASQTSTGTPCSTTTQWTTLTVTVTSYPLTSTSAVAPLPTPTPPAQSSPPPAPPASSSSIASVAPSSSAAVTQSSAEPVKPTSAAPPAPPHSHPSDSSGITSIVSASSPPPYPVPGNSTTSAPGTTGSITAPPHSGTATTTAPLTVTTSGSGKTAINGLAAALVVVGSVFLSL